MNEEITATCELFAAIEGGSEFWSKEIRSLGALGTRDKLLSGGYLESKHSAGKISERIKSLDGEQILEKICESDSCFISPSDERWPICLEDLKAPPIGLIIKGNLANLSYLRTSIAIVGTRNPTSYGSRIAGDFAAGLADRDWMVISGGAIGIDSYAHKGCLAAEGLTVAVLGGGVNRNYPASNQAMFEDIAETGLLISEVMPDVVALPHRFLIRNRLIAALSRATLVVEAAFRSGSLRTARDAAEIYRPVMAVPGPINAPTSEGCHRLISERCAELVSSVGEIMELVLPLEVR